MSGLLFQPPAPPPEPLFRLDFACDPRGKGRGRATRTGPKCPECKLSTGQLIVRAHEASRDLEGRIQKAARGAMVRQFVGKLEGPLFVLVIGRWPRTLDMPDRFYSGRQWRQSSPDFDNLAKLATDALNGVVYGDDRQIVDGRAQTVFHATWEKPGIEIVVWRATMFPETELEAPRPGRIPVEAAARALLKALGAGPVQDEDQEAVQRRVEELELALEQLTEPSPGASSSTTPESAE